MVKAKKIALNFTYIFIILFLLFSRTFSGLNIFGLRIGEYIVGLPFGQFFYFSFSEK